MEGSIFCRSRFHNFSQKTLPNILLHLVNFTRDRSKHSCDKFNVFRLKWSFFLWCRDWDIYLKINRQQFLYMVFLSTSHYTFWIREVQDAAFFNWADISLIEVVVTESFARSRTSELHGPTGCPDYRMRDDATKFLNWFRT